MKNNLKLKLINKISNAFINIGEIHKDQLSVGIAFYEPKVSIELLMDKKSSK